MLERTGAALRRLGLRMHPRLVVGRDVRVSWSARIYTRNVDGLSMGGRISIGDRTRVCDGAIIAAYGGSIHIGQDCYIGPYCVLYGHGGLTIGDQTLIAAHTVIIPANHVYSDSQKPIAAQGETRKGIVIGQDVWIGAGARILDGVAIGEGTVIAAGAVVNSNLPPHIVAAGIPAKQVKDRSHGDAAHAIPLKRSPKS